jgi:hypothetical protein
MADGEVRLQIQGQHGTIDPRALQKAVTGLLELLESAGIESWVITDLHEGSVDLTVAPVGADPELAEKFRTIVQGIDIFESQEALPDSWNLGMVNGLITTGEADDSNGAEGIALIFGDLAPRLVTPAVRANAKNVAHRTHVSIGSVRGRVHRWVSKKGTREVSLIDDASQRTVRVTFRANMEDRVRAAVGEEIRAWGELRRDLDGHKSSLKLDDFDTLPQSARPDSVDDIVGLFNDDWTDGQDSVSWIRSQRDGE